MYYEATVKHLTSNPYSLRSVCLCVTHVLAAEIVSGLSFSSFFSSSSSQTADAAAIMAVVATVAAAETITAAAAVAADKTQYEKRAAAYAAALFYSNVFISSRLMRHKSNASSLPSRLKSA